jgi:hypothetical protein
LTTGAQRPWGPPCVASEATSLWTSSQRLGRWTWCVFACVWREGCLGLLCACAACVCREGCLGLLCACVACVCAGKAVLDSCVRVQRVCVGKAVLDSCVRVQRVCAGKAVLDSCVRVQRVCAGKAVLDSCVPVYRVVLCLMETRALCVQASSVALMVSVPLLWHGCPCTVSRRRLSVAGQGGGGNGVCPGT